MSTSPDLNEAPPPQLDDAWARVLHAREDYRLLEQSLNEFLYSYVEGMEKGWDPDTEGFAIRLRDPNDSTVTGRPAVLTSQILEGLRTALDYLVFELSALNTPDLNERQPQFVIADDASGFENQARTRLRHLTAEQRGFVERLQPYNGNEMLALLREMTGEGKHRRLLSLQDRTGLEIHFAELTKQQDYEGWFVFPVERGQAFFAKAKGPSTFLLVDKYDAMPFVNAMIAHVEDILRASHYLFSIPTEG